MIPMHSNICETVLQEIVPFLIFHWELTSKILIFWLFFWTKIDDSIIQPSSPLYIWNLWYYQNFCNKNNLRALLFSKGFLQSLIIKSFSFEGLIIILAYFLSIHAHQSSLMTPFSVVFTWPSSFPTLWSLTLWNIPCF